MTEKEILEAERGYSESKIQHICVCWFRQTFPQVSHLLFAVPNGGLRAGHSGSTMVYEGQVRGVSDLILLYPSGGKSALCIEMKIPKQKGSSAGKQSKEQKAWQALVEKYGSTYVICHGLLEFIKSVCVYLRINPTPYIDKALNLYPTYR